jgi:hypothetical protein
MRGEQGGSQLGRTGRVPPLPQGRLGLIDPHRLGALLELVRALVAEWPTARFPRRAADGGTSCSSGR